MNRTTKKILTSLTVGSALVLGVTESSFAAQPEELGHVKWMRGFESALSAGKQQKRPVLVLFDEVPGCSTVKAYGRDVLSHPLIVEAAESLFVPVAVYNNVGGDDRVVLDSFKEPAWNNPVVRIMDHDKRPLGPRVAGDYTAAGLASAMVTALEKSNQDVPEYLRLLASDHPKKRSERATFAMYCFWSGEAAIGTVPGVLSTKAGFLGGREVVEAMFDPTRVSYDALLRAAHKAGQADYVFARNDKQHQAAKRIVGRGEASTQYIRYSAKDTKYQIRHTAFRFVPMTEAQATKVNSARAQGKNPTDYLSPRQKRIYDLARNKPKAGWTNVLEEKDIRVAFWKAEQVAGGLAMR